MTIPKPPSQPGCEWVGECIESCSTDPVYVEERGVRATFRNPQRAPVRKIHYDGCYNTAHGVYKADYIVGRSEVIDIIVELKGSGSNIRHAAEQVQITFEAWKSDPIRAPRIACLVIYGNIQGKTKRPGILPRIASIVQSARLDFLRRNKAQLFVYENGERQFTFDEFLRKNDAR